MYVLCSRYTKVMSYCITVQIQIQNKRLIQQAFTYCISHFCWCVVCRCRRMVFKQFNKLYVCYAQKATSSLREGKHVSKTIMSLHKTVLSLCLKSQTRQR